MATVKKMVDISLDHKYFDKVDDPKSADSGISFKSSGEDAQKIDKDSIVRSTSRPDSSKSNREKNVTFSDHVEEANHGMRYDNATHSPNYRYPAKTSIKILMSQCSI